MDAPSPLRASTPPAVPQQSCQAQSVAQDIADDGSMEIAETAQLSGSGGTPTASAGTAAAAGVPPRRQQKKHHLLRHALSEDAKVAAARHFAGNLPEESAALIATFQQRELREAFAAVYSVETSSCNNGWMRGKLLQALGLSPHWQPPRCESEGPAPPPPLPAADPGSEVSRYGQRVTRKRWAGGDSGDDNAAEGSPRDSGGGGGGGARSSKVAAPAASSATTKRTRPSTSPRAVSSLAASSLPSFPLASTDGAALLGGWPPLPPPLMPQPLGSVFSQPSVRIVLSKSSSGGDADLAQQQLGMGPPPPLPPGQGGAPHLPAPYQQAASAGAAAACARTPSPHGLPVFQAAPAWLAADHQAALHTAGGRVGDGSLPPAGMQRSAGSSLGEASQQSGVLGGRQHILAVLEEQQRLYELKRQQLELEKQSIELEMQQEQQRRQLGAQQAALATLAQQRMHGLRLMTMTHVAAEAAAAREASLFAQHMAPPHHPQQQQQQQQQQHPQQQQQRPAMGGVGGWGGCKAEPHQGDQPPPPGAAACRPVSAISAELHSLFKAFDDGQACLAMYGLV